MSMTSKPPPAIVVFGSINYDQFVYCEDELPKPGETVFGNKLANHLGGKSANSAVATARLADGLLRDEGKIDVVMVGAVGNDAHGQYVLNALRQDGIDVSNVCVRSGALATGFAAIAVAKRTGEGACGAAIGISPRPVRGRTGLVRARGG